MWKRFLMIFFMFIIIICSAGCENNKDKKSIRNNDKQNENEYCYQVLNAPIVMKQYGILNACRKDEYIYFYGNEWREDKKDKEGRGRVHHYIISMKIDGSDLQEIELMEMKEEETVKIFTVDDKNQLRFLTYQNYYHKRTGREQRTYYLYTLNEKGEIIEKITLQKEKGKNTRNSFYLDSDCSVFFHGNFYIADDTNIYEFDKNGIINKTYKSGTEEVLSMFLSAEGICYIYAQFDTINSEEYILREFNLNTGEFGDIIELNGSYSYSIYAKEESKIFLDDEINLSIFDLSNKTQKIEFNWLNSGLNRNDVIAYFSLEDETFLIVTARYDEMIEKVKTELITLKKIKVSEKTKKKKITYASIVIDDNIKEKILSFNKTNQKYQIEVRDYSIYEDGKKKLNLDMISDKMPDILDIRELSAEQFIKKDLFLDLYSLMEQDQEVKKEHFIPSVLQTMEQNGELYYLPYRISGIQSFLGSKEIIGDREGWTIEEMIKTYKAMPKGRVFMQGIGKEWFPENIVRNNIEEYVDSTGEVSFDTEDFITLLEFSNEFPRRNEIDPNEGVHNEVLIKEGKLFLESFYLTEPIDMIGLTERYKKQGGYQLISCPSKDKNNKLSMDASGNIFAITKQCKEKEGAWEFIRQFFTYEYQRSNDVFYRGFPVRQDALDLLLLAAQTKGVYIDKDGTEIQLEYGDIRPISKEEINIIYSMIDRIGICNSYHTYREEIYEIMMEELQAFYAEDKSAKETAKLIQSRVKIYVNENL